MARVLLLTHIYPPAIDGGSRVIAKMGDYLKKNNHQLLIVTSNCTSSDDFSKIKHPTVTHPSHIISLPVITFLHRPLKLLSKTFSKGPIFYYLPLIKILTFKPDYILAGPLPTTIVLYARLIRFFTKSKLIINASFHPTDPDFQASILLNTLKSADYIWTLTNFETEYFNKTLHISKNKLINLGNGVDREFLIKNPKYQNNHNLLFIGSFAAHKNISTLITAFSLLPNNYNLTLAGQKTLYSPQIQKQINTLNSNISLRIKTRYSFPDTDLIKLIDNANIVISPSLQESFGLVLIEAMARAKAVITADIPASIELIQKSHAGLTFKAKDPNDLKNKILKLNLDQKLNQQLGQNGLKYVKAYYTWNKIGDNLCQKLGI